MGMLNVEKYRSVILYFAEHVHNIGKVKLWKLLYYLDFDYYEQYQQSVTGETYLRWENGPVPSIGATLLHFMDVNDDITLREEPTGLQYPQLKIEARRVCDRAVFSDTEWDMLEAVARKWRYHTGREMILATHGDVPWLRTKPNGVIPYALALYREEGVNPNEVSEPSEGDTDMELLARTELARRKSLAYAERIERLWETDPVVRARIERGVEQMRTGKVVRVGIDALTAERREGTDPS
jgi:hypothetical protein